MSFAWLKLSPPLATDARAVHPYKQGENMRVPHTTKQPQRYKKKLHLPNMQIKFFEFSNFLVYLLCITRKNSNFATKSSGIFTT